MNVARLYKRLFPFGAGIEDLDGLTPDTGAIGFGPPPCQTRPPGGAPPQQITRATGWRPIITSIGYSTLGDETPHRVRFEFVEKIIDDAKYEGATTITGARWREVVFNRPGTNGVYITGVPVPVSEESSNPFELRITTMGRQNPTMAVVDWEWARFNLDITADEQWRQLQAASETPTPVYAVNGPKCGKKCSCDACRRAF